MALRTSTVLLGALALRVGGGGIRVTCDKDAGVDDDNDGGRRVLLLFPPSSS